MDLFTHAQQRFDGATFDAKRDGARLKIQLDRVRSIMLASGWVTLDEISRRMDDAPPASISARLRDLRKLKFGGYTVERRYRERGLWEYRIPVGRP